MNATLISQQDQTVFIVPVFIHASHILLTQHNGQFSEQVFQQLSVQYVIFPHDGAGAEQDQFDTQAQASILQDQPLYHANCHSEIGQVPQLLSTTVLV